MCLIPRIMQSTMRYQENLSTFFLLNLRILFYQSHIGATFLGQKCTNNTSIYAYLTCRKSIK